MKLQSRACPVCDGRDNTEVLPARFDEERLGPLSFASRKPPDGMHLRMVRCHGCDLLFADPIPGIEWIHQSYREAAFDASEESRHAARTYAGLLEPILAGLPGRERALDIGAGDGAFLERLLDLGFESVLGVEPSSAPVDRAPERIRTFLRREFFRAERFPEASFDLITSFQTLEHVEAPREMAQGIARLLRPGGAFLAVGHDWRAWSARLLGARSPIFDIEHLQIHSAQSLRFLLSFVGLEQIEVGPVANVYPLRYWLRLLPLPPGLKGPLARRLEGSRLGERRISLRAGNLSVVGRRATVEVGG